MQNRSTYRIEYQPYALSPSLPIAGIGNGDVVLSSEKVTMLHAHNHLELGLCVEGSGVFFVDDKILPFSKGDVSIIFAGQVHIARSNGKDLSRWKFLVLDPLLMLSKFQIPELAQLTTAFVNNRNFCNILSPSTQPEIVSLISTLVSELEARASFHTAAMQGITLALVSAVCRQLQALPADSEPASAASAKWTGKLSRLSPALAYISEHYGQPIEIDRLAGLCNLSTVHFRRLFTRRMQLSPLEYIVKIRIQMAMVLLTSGEDRILDVALQVGYPTLSSFNRQFKRLTGLSPSQWRKQNK